MAVNCFDAKAVLDEVAQYLPISTKEVEEIHQRLLALATRTTPPVWGYAGMLLDAAKDRDTEDWCHLDFLITHWENSPILARKEFDDWNADRLAK